MQVQLTKISYSGTLFRVWFIQDSGWVRVGPSWAWSYGSWIYNYLCNQCLSPLLLWVQILFMRGVLVTTLCDKVCQ